MKYRKKPITIEALQLTITNVDKMKRFTNDNIRRFYRDGAIDHAEIETLKGNMIANVGDYIIKDANGEFYPCKPDVFKKTYEEVTEDK